MVKLSKITKQPTPAMLQPGKKVGINPDYGGGHGVVLEEAPGYSGEYFIVRVGRKSHIYHYTDLLV
jgi:hypothetical protein